MSPAAMDGIVPDDGGRPSQDLEEREGESVPRPGLEDAGSGAEERRRNWPDSGVGVIATCAW